MSQQRVQPTPEQRAQRARGRLDQRCRACGATCAATSYCPACQGIDLEYRDHSELTEMGAVSMWCATRGGDAA